MLKLPSFLALLAVAAGCASTPPAGLQPGRFVAFSCADSKTFQARLADDRKTIRVRGHHGAAELEPKGAGVYEGEGYVLQTQGSAAVSLSHAGKSQGQSCKAAS